MQRMLKHLAPHEADLIEKFLKDNPTEDCMLSDMFVEDEWSFKRSIRSLLWQIRHCKKMDWLVDHFVWNEDGKERIYKIKRARLP